MERERRAQNRLRRRALQAVEDQVRQRRAELDTDEYRDWATTHRGMVASESSPNSYKAVIGNLTKLMEMVESGNFDRWGYAFSVVYGSDLGYHGAAEKIYWAFESRETAAQGRTPFPGREPCAVLGDGELRALLASERERYQAEYEARRREPHWLEPTAEQLRAARELEDLGQDEQRELDRSRAREYYLRGAIDRKLRVILALAKEARQQAKDTARREAEGEQGQPPGRERGHEPSQEPRMPGEPRRSSPNRSAAKSGGGIPKERIPDSRPDTKPDAKNEGTNRGSPVESTHGAAS